MCGRTHIGHHTGIRKYYALSAIQTNWDDLDSTHWPVFEPEPIDTFETIETILAATYEKQTVQDYIWEQSPSLEVLLAKCCQERQRSR